MHYEKFHKTCRNFFDNHHVQRAKKKIDHSAARSSCSSSNFQQHYIFCDSSDECLRNASSFVIVRGVRQAAVLLGDDKLVAKLSEGDMPAIEVKYHPSCLCRLYSKAAYLQKSGSNINEHAVMYEIFLSETTRFIRKESETAPVFMFSELK